MGQNCSDDEIPLQSYNETEALHDQTIEKILQCNCLISKKWVKEMFCQVMQGYSAYLMRIVSVSKIQKRWPHVSLVVRCMSFVELKRAIRPCHQTPCSTCRLACVAGGIVFARVVLAAKPRAASAEGARRRAPKSRENSACRITWLF